MNIARITGVTRKGNGIARQMHQAKRSMTTNVAIAGSMAVNMIGSAMSADLTTLTTSAGVGYLTIGNIVKADKEITKLAPDYGKIVERAKSIYKDNFVM
ncbi:MAG: hypothetical protein E7Z89_01615 [Cyanobacteria bacterium SIG28]|nr:hypothetical protein [Cyanobacteria bacterium SIG28]